MQTPCAHCELPPCPSCFAAGRCAFCDGQIDTAEADATVLEVDAVQLAKCIEQHENWANLFILHRRTKHRIRLRENPGCWLLIWGWPLLIFLGATLGAVHEALSGRPGAQAALFVPVIVGAAFALGWWWMESTARVKAASRASLPVLDLLATGDTDVCLECEVDLAVAGSGMVACEACGARHLVQPPIEEMSQSMRLERLVAAKRLGHEAAAQAETVHLARWPLSRPRSSAASRQIHEAYFQPACLAKIRRLTF